MRLLRARCSQALQLSRVNNSLEQIDSINSAGHRAVYFVKQKGNVTKVAEALGFHISPITFHLEQTWTKSAL